MMKKIAALAGASALLLGAAVPVFAWGSWGGSRDVAIVDNEAVAVANTGGNGQGNVVSGNGGYNDDTTVSGDNSMSTGGASAYAGALVVANTHIGCGCDGVGANHGGGGSHHTDFALVGNSAGAGANTGDNGQGNIADLDGGHNDDTNVGGNNSMSTGNASSTARAWTIVNTHWGH